MNKPDLGFCCVLVRYLCHCGIYLCNLCSSPLRFCCVLVRYFCTCNPGISTVVIGVHNHRGLKGLFLLLLLLLLLSLRKIFNLMKVTFRRMPGMTIYSRPVSNQIFWYTDSDYPFGIFKLFLCFWSTPCKKISLQKKSTKSKTLYL